MKKMLIMLLVFLVAGGLVFWACSIAGANRNVGLPQPITEQSACPVVNCASGNCHGYENVPEPDGVHTMSCPEKSCDSVECHAWDTLENRYGKASDFSLNLWVLAPVALVLALVLIVKKVR